MCGVRVLSCEVMSGVSKYVGIHHKCKVEWNKVKNRDSFLFILFLRVYLCCWRLKMWMCLECLYDYKLNASFTFFLLLRMIFQWTLFSLPKKVFDYINRIYMRRETYTIYIWRYVKWVNENTEENILAASITLSIHLSNLSVENRTVEQDENVKGKEILLSCSSVFLKLNRRLWRYVMCVCALTPRRQLHTYK